MLYFLGAEVLTFIAFVSAICDNCAAQKLKGYSMVDVISRAKKKSDRGKKKGYRKRGSSCDGQVDRSGGRSEAISCRM